MSGLSVADSMASKSKAAQDTTNSRPVSLPFDYVMMNKRCMICQRSMVLWYWFWYGIGYCEACKETGNGYILESADLTD